MSDDDLDVPLVFALALATELERRGISYAIGGALALGVWGYARGTIDVDVNIFVEPEELDGSFDALEAVGVPVDRAQASRAAAQHGMFVVLRKGMHVDVFTPSIPFSREAERTKRRVRVPALDQEAEFLSAESIAIFKLLFFRGKDKVDLEYLAAAQPDLDHAYVRRAIVDMLGEEDPRVAFWDEQTRRFGSTT